MPSKPPVRPRRAYHREPEQTPLAKSCALRVWSEETLLRLPWAALKGGCSASLAYRGPSPGRSRVVWEAAGRDGLPGPFEREVFRACEWTAIEEARRTGGELPDPFVFTGRDLCERLCLRETPAMAERLHAAFRRLAGLRLKGTPIGGLLELADGFAAPWSESRGLETRRSIRFDPAFRASVKAGRTVALCWDAWISGGPGARRLLEILAPELAGFRETGEISLHVADLARLFPLRDGSLEEVLTAAHVQLQASGFLRAVRRAGTGSFARVIYEKGKAAEALLERMDPAHGTAVSVLARELAAELGEEELGLDSLQRLVERHAPEAIEAAVNDVRLRRRWGWLKESPRAYFERAIEGGRTSTARRA